MGALFVAGILAAWWGLGGGIPGGGPAGGAPAWGESPPGALAGTPAPREEAETLFRQGLVFWFGAGRPADEARSAALFSRAAEGGHDLAPLFLGLQWFLGAGVSQDRLRGERLAEAALPPATRKAQAGDPLAQMALGVWFRSGVGSPAGDLRSAAWFARAAEQGIPEAQNLLGVLFWEGRGVSRDLARSAVWWRRAAERGCAGAQRNLGMLYAKGWGVSPDHARAAVWFARSAAQGHRGAQNDLGFLYQFGLGVSPDLREAYRWHHTAACLGDALGAAEAAALAEDPALSSGDVARLRHEVDALIRRRGWDRFP